MLNKMSIALFISFSYNPAMNLNFFADPNMAPRPRDEVKIEDIVLTPYSDGQRVRVQLQITAFLPSDRPDIDIDVRNSHDEIVSTVSVVQAVQPNIDLTAHLRRPDPTGTYSFEARLFYDRETVHHTITQTLKIEDANEDQSNDI